VGGDSGGGQDLRGAGGGEKTKGMIFFKGWGKGGGSRQSVQTISLGKKKSRERRGMPAR